MAFTRDFYRQPTLTVAAQLLGQYLVYHHPQGTLVGEINEVESYIGMEDPACHAACGPTERNRIMFGDGGFSYIYLSYGIHYCLNIVTEEAGKPAAILIRGLIPREGIAIMRTLREKSKPITDLELTNGPGKICQAYQLTKAQNGLDITNSTLTIEPSGKLITNYQMTSRIGISKAQEKLWRFVYASH